MVLEIVILGVQAFILLLQALLFMRQNNLIQSGTDSQLLLEVYKSFFENPLYSAITKAIDRKKLGEVDPAKIKVSFNERSRTYSIGEHQTGAKGPNIPIGTLEDFLDDYLGWFDVLGVLIRSGQLTDEKAEALFRYYLEMALETAVVKEYLDKSCSDLKAFKTYWRGLDYLIDRWKLRDLLPEKFH